MTELLEPFVTADKESFNPASGLFSLLFLILYAVTNEHYIKEKLLESETSEHKSSSAHPIWNPLFREMDPQQPLIRHTMFCFECNHKMSKVPAFSFFNIAYYEANFVREG